jgi:hypothetical protein
MMIVSSTITILLTVVIILLLISLCLFLASKYLQKVAKRKAAERYRGKGALLPIANIHTKKQRMTTTMMKHPSLTFEDADSFRKSFYQFPDSPLSTSLSCLSVPEIRITFPDEDVPAQHPGLPGQRTSQVVVVRISESGAAYVTAPPRHEGLQNVDMANVGGLKGKF